jgi:MSHA pilin protein MshC
MEPTMRSQAGFTLAELVIVMMVIGILAVVAVPRMFDMDQFSARGTRDYVGAALRYAQKSAIAMRRNVCVSVGATQLTITYASTSGADQACSGAELLNPSNNLAYSHASNALPERAPVSTPATVIFDAQGRPLSAPSTPRSTALSISVTGNATPLTIEPETGTVR